MESNNRIGIFICEWFLQSQAGYTAQILIENGFKVDFFLYKPLLTYFRVDTIPGVTVHDLTSVAPSIDDLLPESLISATLSIIEQSNYSWFIGFEKLGLAWAGKMNEHTQVPFIYYSLELYTWDYPGYAGIPRFERAKELERRYHAKAVATIVQDSDRAAVLLQDNQVTETKLLLVPVSVPGPAQTLRGNFFNKMSKVTTNQRIILVFGQKWRFTPELIEASQYFPEQWVLALHGGGTTEFDIQKIKSQDKNNRIVFSTDFLPDQQISNIIASADIGLAFYGNHTINNYLTGSASEKMALYLQVGLPVVTYDYPSFRQIIERYQCGICIANLGYLVQAIKTILTNYQQYRDNAFTCFQDYYDFRKQFQKVIDFIK